MSDRPRASKEEAAFDGPFVRLARRLLALGIRPNHFSLLQLPVFAVMVWAAWTDHRWTFAWISWLVIVLDGGDGILARVGGLQSKAGAILDATMDTVGIAVVLWGAAQFFPEYGAVYAYLFVINVALFLQNTLFERKIVSYVRGPVLLAVAFPDTLVLSLAVPVITGTVMLAGRARQTVARLRRPVAA